MNQDLATRMKLYESLTGSQLMPGLPVLARMDGRAFHTWTKGLERPLDPGFRALMVETTAALVKETSALCGYTQSDEITLLWAEPDLFDGRVVKLATILASIATAAFNLGVAKHLPGKVGQIAHFDARVFSVPSREEAFNAFLWREQDATRNSIASAAQSVCTRSELHGKNSNEQQELMFQKGINWNDYPASFKRGTWLMWEQVSRPFSAEELEDLPPQHNARKNPNLVVQRRVLTEVSPPPLGSIPKEDRLPLIFGA